MGLFSFKLSSVFKEVFSLEPDKNSIKYSETKYGSQSNINFINEEFIDYDFKCQKFDFITAIASIHHMDFKKALIKTKTLLKPGGKAAILGLYKESSVPDFLISSIAIFPNFIMNILSVQNKKHDRDMITTLPEMTIKEIIQVSNNILRHYKFKRHLFWRYSLIYKKDQCR